ncbi:YceI family protein [Pedobacter sp. MR2016-24]|uniref:YceI family protein n=1 Tax=Pedobacter sp. MR2016-24 TaxID=2994466 RepID=UPI002247CD8C|nr:YceI family protein [Pedobacter sp. MR2016-24]MCX2483851.1 YceI family protein [Pedobacter sp. MR2016-24]
MTTNLSETHNGIQTNWKVDPLHSELFFKIKYLTISVVTGFVQVFDLNVQTTGNDFGEVTELQLTADMTTLMTNHGPRDEHLKSSDFFDVDNYRYLQFRSTAFHKQGQTPPSLLAAYRRDYKLHGYLQIKDVSRPIVLDGGFGGLVTDPDGHRCAGFTVKTKISRKEFGLGWGGITAAGKLILADEVDIFGNIQLIKQV